MLKFILINAAWLAVFSATVCAQLASSTQSPAIKQPVIRLSNGTDDLLEVEKPVAETQIYQVGRGDVLDVQITNFDKPMSRRVSSLSTVLSDGTIEIDLLAQPMTVAGMTVDNIAAQVTVALRRIGFPAPRATVSVREYASHSVWVNGLVEAPGKKVLSREAVPLFVIIAQAQPHSDAGIVIITNARRQTHSVRLDDAKAMNHLVRHGDTLRVTVAPPPARKFVYVSGAVKRVGQQEFHDGLTLTQLLVSLGESLNANNNLTARISRTTDNGVLTGVEYGLKKIINRQTPDPLLQAGDRIEVLSKRARIFK